MLNKFTKVGDKNRSKKPGPAMNSPGLKARAICFDLQRALAHYDQNTRHEQHDKPKKTKSARNYTVKTHVNDI
jgi:hypothetical protein